MTPELQKQLFIRHARIFVEHALPKTETGMCWGICCGDGWFNLIDKLCCDLQKLTDESGDPQIIATQVKDKFGSLRFYVRKASDAQRACIDAAIKTSGETCDLCGKQGAAYIANSTQVRCHDCSNRSHRS